MEFMLIVHEPRGQREARSPAEGEEVYAVMKRWAGTLAERGLLRGGEALERDSQAVRVQVRDGRPRLFDGPFAEAKEMVGGFFLVDCAGREQALALAAECPAAAWATVEVRALAPCYA